MGARKYRCENSTTMEHSTGQGKGQHKSPERERHVGNNLKTIPPTVPLSHAETLRAQEAWQRTMWHSPDCAKLFTSLRCCSSPPAGCKCSPGGVCAVTTAATTQLFSSSANRSDSFTKDIVPALCTAGSSPKHCSAKNGLIFVPLWSKCQSRTKIKSIF